MDKAILIFLGIVLLVPLTFAIIEERQKSGLSPRQSRKLKELLNDGAKVMSGIGLGYDVDNVDILTDETKKNIKEWMSEYRKYGGENELV